MNTHQISGSTFALCLKNEGYEADLDIGTVYLVLSDESATHQDRVRVVDESGDDYLYPKDYFTPVSLSTVARDAISAAVK